MNIMIDIETLGTTQAAPVISIGACAFNPDTGDCDVAGFHKRINWGEAIKGRDVSGDTLQWWMAQGDNARQAVIRPGVTVMEALQAFTKWLALDCIVWGNGSTFDIAILENLYQQYSLDIPWKFYNVRDVRTVVAIADGIASREDVEFEGVPHSALDDAIHQAKYINHLWAAVRDGR